MSQTIAAEAGGQVRIRSFPLPNQNGGRLSRCVFQASRKLRITAGIGTCAEILLIVAHLMRAVPGIHELMDQS